LDCLHVGFSYLFLSFAHRGLHMHTLHVNENSHAHAYTHTHIRTYLL